MYCTPDANTVRSIRVVTINHPHCPPSIRRCLVRNAICVPRRPSQLHRWSYREGAIIVTKMTSAVDQKKNRTNPAKIVWEDRGVGRAAYSFWAIETRASVRAARSDGRAHNNREKSQFVDQICTKNSMRKRVRFCWEDRWAPNSNKVPSKYRNKSKRYVMYYSLLFSLFIVIVLLPFEKWSARPPLFHLLMLLLAKSRRRFGCALFGCIRLRQCTMKWLWQWYTDVLMFGNSSNRYFIQQWIWFSRCWHSNTQPKYFEYSFSWRE